jgi:hypothetical protein
VNRWAKRARERIQRKTDHEKTATAIPNEFSPSRKTVFALDGKNGRHS